MQAIYQRLGDGNQGEPSLKDPVQLPNRPITRSRAKKIKETMQGLVQSTWDEASKSPTMKVGLKEGEPILIHLIQAVEDMTQVYCLGLFLLQGFIQLNDLFYQFRISGPCIMAKGIFGKLPFLELGFQKVTVAELLQRRTVPAGVFLGKKGFILARVLIRFWFKYSLQPHFEGR